MPTEQDYVKLAISENVSKEVHIYIYMIGGINRAI